MAENENGDKIVTDAPSLDTRINCEICGWYGTLREAKHTKSYSHTSISHEYVCPECNSDIYHWTEDKSTEADTSDVNRTAGGPTHHVSPPSGSGVD